MPADADTGGDDDVIHNPQGAEVGADEDDTPVPLGGGGTVGRRERKPINKALFQAAAAAAKAHVQGEDPDDELEVEPPPAAGAAAPGTTTPPAGTEQPKSPAGPPPEAIAAWERVNLRSAALDKREQELRDREGKYGDIASRFAAKPLDTLKALVRMDLGDDATEDEVSEELGWQLTHLSMEHAGATIDPANQAHQLRQNKREIRRMKAERRRETGLKAQREAETTNAARRQEALAHIGEEFKAISSKYPFLAADEDAPGLIFAAAEKWHKQHGDIPELPDLAQRAEDVLREAATATFKRYHALLQPTPTPTPAPGSVPQGDPPNRRSRTLSNTDASEDAGGHHPDVPGKPLTVEERRRRTWQKHRDALQKADRD